jgi:hypothetical protein
VIVENDESTPLVDVATEVCPVPPAPTTTEKEVLVTVKEVAVL